MESSRQLAAAAKLRDVRCGRIWKSLCSGGRRFPLKSDADDYLVAAVHAISLHKPFFTGLVSERCLHSFLAKVAMRLS